MFIDFFRGKAAPEFESLVEENRAVLSGLIRSIPNPAIYGIAENLLTRIRSEAMTIGLVDLLLAAEANLNRQLILSPDKVFERMALKGFIKAA